MRDTIWRMLIWRVIHGRTLVELEKLGMSGSRDIPERFENSFKQLMMPLTPPRLQVEKMVMSASRGLQEINPIPSDQLYSQMTSRKTTPGPNCIVVSTGSTGDQQLAADGYKTSIHLQGIRPTTRKTNSAVRRSTGDHHISLSLSVQPFFKYCTLTICNFVFNNKNNKTRECLAHKRSRQFMIFRSSSMTPSSKY